MNRPLKKLFSGIALTSLLLAATPVVTEAQCPMCRMSAESNLKNGGTAGKGLNKGIIMLFSMPYMLVGGVAYVWYKNRREDEEEIFNENLN